MSGKPFDHKAKKRLARHIIGGSKEEAREKAADHTGTCKECGSQNVKVNSQSLCLDCEDETEGLTKEAY